MIFFHGKTYFLNKNRKPWRRWECCCCFILCFHEQGRELQSSWQTNPGECESKGHGSYGDIVPVPGHEGGEPELGSQP